MHGHACDCGRPLPDFLPPKSQPPKLASFSQAGHTLTDADVERVAKAVAERLIEQIAERVAQKLAERLAR